MSLKLRQLLQEVAAEKAPGPPLSFTLFHLLLALETMARKPIGRGKLAEKLDLGEGAARTLVRRMVRANLIATSRTGCSLTDRGLRLWKEYDSIFKKAGIEKSELSFGNYSCAILIKNVANKVTSGMEQRDSAVAAGAKGATTILFRKGHLAFARSHVNVSENFPKASNQILKLLRPEENDVIIIASSDNSKKAEYSALAAAWTLLGSEQG
jgi:DNA-binding MarR family transcriptional regulator